MSQPKKTSTPRIRLCRAASKGKSGYRNWIATNSEFLDDHCELLLNLLLEHAGDIVDPQALIEQRMNTLGLKDLSLSSWQKRLKGLELAGIITRKPVKKKPTDIALCPAEQLPELKELDPSIAELRLILSNSVLRKDKEPATPAGTSTDVFAASQINNGAGEASIALTPTASSLNDGFDVELLIQQLYLVCTQRPRQNLREIVTNFSLFGVKANVLTRSRLGVDIARVPDYKLVLHLYTEIVKNQKLGQNSFVVAVEDLARAIYGRTRPKERRLVVEAMNRIYHTNFTVTFDTDHGAAIGSVFELIGEEWQAINSLTSIRVRDMVGAELLGHSDTGKSSAQLPDMFRFSIPEVIFRRIQKNQFMLRIPPSILAEKSWFSQILVGVFCNLMVASGEESEDYWFAITDKDLFKMAFSNRMQRFEFKNELHALFDSTFDRVQELHHLLITWHRLDSNTTVIKFRGLSQSSTNYLDLLPRNNEAPKLKRSEIATLEKLEAPGNTNNNTQVERLSDDEPFTGDLFDHTP